ncbi:hypothetical protein [Streptomyces sp. Y7]|uniref:hypothetical protein n=1 Tax=Streptomyces sp. Y7 TaxID=3342392 RepID=UPI0037241F72
MDRYAHPTPPGPWPKPDHSHDAERSEHRESHREATDHAGRVLLLVNTVPLAAGILLSCFTEVPAVPVLGPLTLGLLWNVLQCCLFVATAWWYDASWR